MVLRKHPNAELRRQVREAILRRSLPLASKIKDLTSGLLAEHPPADAIPGLQYDDGKILTLQLPGGT
jgi:hypothetical protein